jgi:hypothetical protein
MKTAFLSLLLMSGQLFANAVYTCNVTACEVIDPGHLGNYLCDFTKWQVIEETSETGTLAIFDKDGGQYDGGPYKATAKETGIFYDAAGGSAPIHIFIPTDLESDGMIISNMSDSGINFVKLTTRCTK